MLHHIVIQKNISERMKQLHEKWGFEESKNMVSLCNFVKFSATLQLNHKIILFLLQYYRIKKSEKNKIFQSVMFKISSA